ncbi:DUF1064 domain-containing protein [Facklamia sp. P12934]
MKFKPKRKHKYRAKKVVVNGITFDSKAEAMYYNHTGKFTHEYF